MKMQTMAVLAFCVSAAPALAWNNTQTGHQNQIVDATGSQAQQQRATGGRATATGGNVTNNVTGGGMGGYGFGGPTITVPDIATAAPCGGGLSLGGVGLGGGGSGGGNLWEFADCKRIREANMLRAIARETNNPVIEQGALNELCQIDRVKRAFGGSCPQVERPHKVVLKRMGDWPDWCYTASAGERMQHFECARRYTTR